MGRASRAKKERRDARERGEQPRTDAPDADASGHAKARAEVDEMIRAGELDPANVVDDGHTIRVSSGWEISPELRAAMNRNP